MMHVVTAYSVLTFSSGPRARPATCAEVSIICMLIAFPLLKFSTKCIYVCACVCVCEFLVELWPFYEMGEELFCGHKLRILITITIKRTAQRF